MDRSIPHFLRFTRALALVSGALVLPACGGAVDTGTGVNDPDAAAYDGYAVGTLPYDGGNMGTAPYDASLPGIDAGITGYPYDGGPVGTPVYDGGPTGVPPVYDGGPVGVAPYDGGPIGTPVYDAGVADADTADVFMGGGPLDPPDFPA